MGQSVLFSMFLHTAIIIFSIPAITFCRQINIDKKSFVILPTPEITSESFSKSEQPFQPAEFLEEANGGRTKRASEPVKVRSFKIVSDIRYRYSRTQVTSRVVNPSELPRELQFQVLLPETAFISKFVMEIDGKSYEAYVKEKEEAKNIYNRAQQRGQSAGLVQINSRSSNIFNVNVNVGGRAKVNFNLTYEELLQRKFGLYEQSISITPDQLLKVDDYQVEVNIEESQNLTVVKVPQLILSNEVDAPPPGDNGAADEQLNTDANITRLAGNKVQIKWTPSEKDRREIANQKLTGKFLVQYDLHRELGAGQVLVMNGYFVHFFAPTNLAQLRKHVVFVLDISGSMHGTKMRQMKEAMTTILAELQPEDYFNIVTFSTDVKHWTLSGTKNANSTFRALPISATVQNLTLAQNYIKALDIEGATNIHDALISGLNVVQGRKRAEVLPEGIESLVLFLTDGEPNVGVTNPTEIQKRVREANKDDSVPIFSLAFGNDADFPFIQKLSLQNQGFGRKIYEAADAALQLKGFYREISSPLLSQVSFNYTTSPGYRVRDVTTHKFPTIFNGTEIVICGFLEEVDALDIAETPSVVMENSTSTSTEDQTENVQFFLEMAPEQNETEESELHRHLVVNIEGRGRDAYVHFDDPEVTDISTPLNKKRKWSTIHDILPTTESTTTEAPSIASQEDSFLEKLWAYLTIKQLIDENTANTPETPTLNQRKENSTNLETIETAKEKALRLALKYGFVTSLTSLVVVKPNVTDSVTDTVAAKAESRPDSSYSLRGLQPNNLSPTSFGSSSQSMPTHQSASGSFGGLSATSFGGLAATSFGGSPSYSDDEDDEYNVGDHGLVGTILGGASATSDYDDYDALQSPVSNAGLSATSYGGVVATSFGGSSINRIAQKSSGSRGSGSPRSPLPSTTSFPRSLLRSTTSVPPTTSTTSLRPTTSTPFTTPRTRSSRHHQRQLYHLKWLSASQTNFQVNGTSYKIAVNETSQELDGWRTGESCQFSYPSQSGRSHGTCQHLRECVNAAFRTDENVYRNSFFCPISSSSPSEQVAYAGVCCPTRRHRTKRPKDKNDSFSIKGME